MLNVGLIGAGRWGRLVLRDLVALGCRVSVVDPDGDARRAACDGGAAFVTQITRSHSMLCAAQRTRPGSMAVTGDFR